MYVLMIELGIINKLSFQFYLRQNNNMFLMIFKVLYKYIIYKYMCVKLFFDDEIFVLYK